MIVATLLLVNKQNDPNDDEEASLDFDGILSQKKQVDVASITEFFWIKNMKLLSFCYSIMVKYMVERKKNSDLNKKKSVKDKGKKIRCRQSMIKIFNLMVEKNFSMVGNNYPFPC